MCMLIVEEGVGKGSITALCCDKCRFPALEQDEQACCEGSLHIVLPMFVRSSREVLTSHMQTGCEMKECIWE